jgi:amino acid transporter
VLAMVCLVILRRREPHLFLSYRAPVARLLPIAVVVLSLFAAWVYLGIDVNVLPLTLFLYVIGLGYYGAWARRRIQTAAPEELAARHRAEETGKS